MCSRCVRACEDIQGTFALTITGRGFDSRVAAAGGDDFLSSECVSCGACARACKMDVDITKTPNHAECIRCGMCIKSCPTKAIHYQYGFGDKADNSKEI